MPRYLNDEILSNADREDRKMWGYLKVLDKFGLVAFEKPYDYKVTYRFLERNNISFYCNEGLIWFAEIKNSLQEVFKMNNNAIRTIQKGNTSNPSGSRK